VRPADAQRLPTHARELFGIELKSGELARFEKYLHLVEAWSSRMSLVSTSSRRHLVDRHLLDSLAPLRFVREAREAVDFGSGAGFPAIPLAVLAPGTRFHLVEARQKRATFLRHVTRALELANVRVWEGRGESWAPDQEMEVALGRAIRPDALADLGARVLAPAGLLVVMRKQRTKEPPPQGFTEAGRLAYRLPRGEQHEVAVFRRSR